MRRRLLPLALLACLALLSAACGSGTTSSSSGGSMPAGAKLVRAGVLAFVSVDSDLGSSQWKQLDELSQKFQGRDRVLAQLSRKLSEHGVDWKHDVEPALGRELDVAVVSGGTKASTKAVALTKPDDAARFKALVAKLNASDSSGSPAVYREVDGWYALADGQAAITAALKGDQSALSDHASFKAALDKLPGDTLAKIYVDGQRLNALVSEAAATSGSGLGSSSLGLDALKYVAGSVSAESSGLRIRGASSGGNLGAGDFASKLIGDVPENAFALLDFSGQGATDQLGKLRSSPQLGAALGQLKQQLGVAPEELFGLLSGELAFYLRPGTVIPELTLALKAQDVSSALATLDKLSAHLAAANGGRVEPGTQDGHAVKTVKLGQFAVNYGSVGGDTIVITTGENGVADFGSSGSLPDGADFKEAKDAAGMPDSTGDVVYVDIKNVVPLLEAFAALSGRSLPSEVTANLEPLRSFLAWSNGSASDRTYDAFLEIK